MKTPRPLKKPVWCVHVYGKLVEGHYMSHSEISDLLEEHGKEYVDNLGPSEDFAPEWTYGPYTEKQAKDLAECLKRPEVAEREEVSNAVALPMLRWRGSPETLLEKQRKGELT